MPSRFEFQLQSLLERREARTLELRCVLAECAAVLGQADKRCGELHTAYMAQAGVVAEWQSYIADTVHRAGQHGAGAPVLAAAGRQLLEAAAELQKLAAAGQAARASAEAARKTLESAKDDYIASVRGEHQLRTLRRIQQREFITRQERKEVAELAETGAAMYFLNCRGAEETDA